MKQLSRVTSIMVPNILKTKANDATRLYQPNSRRFGEAGDISRYPRSTSDSINQSTPTSICPRSIVQVVFPDTLTPEAIEVLEKVLPERPVPDFDGDEEEPMLEVGMDY